MSEIKQMEVITHEFSLEQFNSQIQFAIANYKAHGLTANSFDNIVIGGLGGSGIGGRIAKAYFADKSSLPIEVYSDYNLPKYTSPKSLVILCSYSGSTEETLALYDQAKAIGCSIICISSGGELFQNATQDQYPLYVIETGYQPRMALGFSLSYLLLILGDLFGVETKKELENNQAIYNNRAEYQKLAMDITNTFEGKENTKFAVVTDNATEAVGIRFCQQIQENAKLEAFVNVLPEANHNVFETYYGELPTNFIFINSNTNSRNNGRFAYLKQLLEKQNNKVVEINLKDASIFELYKAIYITDWVSIYLSDKRGSDKMHVPNIMGLKNFLKTF
jgi:glucose/mannose-6-phosphate isomerase